MIGCVISDDFGCITFDGNFDQADLHHWESVGARAIKGGEITPVRTSAGGAFMDALIGLSGRYVRYEEDDTPTADDME